MTDKVNFYHFPNNYRNHKLEGRVNFPRVGVKLLPQVHIALFFSKFTRVFGALKPATFPQYMWYYFKNLSDLLPIYPTCLVNIHIPSRRRSKVTKWRGNS